MTSKGLGEMFDGDSADMCAGKFLLMSMGGPSEGLACADPGERTPISVSGNLKQPILHQLSYLLFHNECHQTFDRSILIVVFVLFKSNGLTMFFSTISAITTNLYSLGTFILYSL